MTFTNFKNFIEELMTCNISKENLDGRVDSIKNEDEVINYLKNTIFKNDNNFKKAPQPRYWYDCSYEDIDGNFAPINVKVTEGNSADNISSKFGIYYALTGLSPVGNPDGNINIWEKFNKSLRKNTQINNKDYYFIIFFKDSKTFFVTSLKRIETLVSNGNNLPFQCNWKNNLNFTKRTYEEQQKYIIKTFIESFKKRSKGLNVLLDWEDELL